MNFSAAVFDLDGTLLDSLDVWKRIDERFLHKRGLEVPDDYAAKLCALSFKEAADYTIRLFGLRESADEVMAEWNALAADEYARNVALKPYAADYLLRLKERGVKLAVATALPENLYRPCLEHNGILSLFDVLCSADQVACGKESPDLFFFTAGQLKISPGDCLMFDDVLPAVRSAKQAGMMVFGVYDRHSEDQREAIEALADGYILDFRHAPLP